MDESDMLTAYYWMSSASLHPQPLSSAPRTLQMFLHGWTWGYAALHPRLYAVTRSAGSANLFALMVLGFRCASPQERGTKNIRGRGAVDRGIMRGTLMKPLSPAPRALRIFFALMTLGFRCASPQALRCRPLRGQKYYYTLISII